MISVKKKSDFSIIIRGVRYVFLFLIVFFGVNNFEITLLPLSPQKITFLVMLFFLPLFITRVLAIDKTVFLVVSFISLILLYNILMYLLSPTPGLTFLTGWFVYLYMFIFACIVIKVFKINLIECVNILFVVGFIQALAIMLQYHWSFFANFVEMYIPIGGNFTVEPDHRYRGFSNAAGATVSVLQSFSALILIFLYRINSFGFIKFFLLLVIVSYSILLSGRTGFLVYPFIFVFYFLTIRKDKTNFARDLSFLFVSVFLFTLLVTYILFFSSTEEKVFSWVSREFTSNNNYGVIFPTIHVLFSEHFLIIDDINILLLGRQDFWLENRVETDIGYLRMIYSQGLLVTFIFISTICFMFKRARERIGEHPISVFFSIFFVWLLVLQFKEPFMFDPSVGFFISFLCFSVLLYNKGFMSFNKLN